ncbi:MAG: M18 family aminopeptidase [Proteobacteria bacterium]|nr:M18 family aminopeptidase [Pseudomonadota bacterium]
MNNDTFNGGLFDFLKHSPTAFHGARYLEGLFSDAGFIKLSEADLWKTMPGGRYYVVRNNATIIAFVCGDKEFTRSGFRMIGAHTDSPGLKVKPQPEITAKSFVQLGVEVYGSPILSTWFDRELSLAGRVSFVDENHTQGPMLSSVLVDFKDPVAIIPNLAIHLDREVNNGKNINKQNDLPPLVMLDGQPSFRFIDHLKKQMELMGQPVLDEYPIDFDLMLYDPTGPVYTGLNREFITGGRLDNLVSCYCGALALLDYQGDIPALLVCNDHEEVGSVSASGAAGNFLTSVLKRLCQDPETYARSLSGSLMISADNAHGVHPSFGDRYEPNHSPVLNQGPVIKYNANQRYATDSRTGAAFRYLCTKAQVPFQAFVVRSDMPCGSTIGPVTAGGTGIKTLDAGIPMLAMHSIRETAGASDAFMLYKVLSQHIRTVIL